MGTTAAVYIESLGKVVRVNSDGYPEHMIPALEYFEAAGLMDAFAAQVEYSVVVNGQEMFDRLLGHGLGERSDIQVDGVGWAFSEPIRLRGNMVAGQVRFSQAENHHYVIATNGDIREVTKDGAPVSA